MHLCIELTVATWMLEPFGEVGAIFSLQISSQTQFAKIKMRKSSSKIDVENINKSCHMTA